VSLGKKMAYARGNLKYIPLFEQWLYNGSRDLKRHHEIMGQIFDRPERIRTNSFSASGAGQCLRRRQLAYLGYPQAKPEPKTMGIFVNGDFVHLKHQIAGIQMGYLLGAEVSVKQEEYRLTGTMDGEGSDGEIAEFKSINDNGFGQVSMYGPKHEHVEQVHSYMLASGKDEARILYENKNTQELKEFLLKRNSQTMRKVEDDLKFLNDCTDHETLYPPMSECTEKKGAYRSCPFREVCLGARFESQQKEKPVELGRSIRVRRSSANA